jgi:hypothetical protein
MSYKVTKIKMQQGVWHGIVTGDSGAPLKIDVSHENMVLTNIELDHDAVAGHWTLVIPIPPSAVADGVQTLIIRDITADRIIGHITLLAGEALGEDLRAEMDLMRAELDMLKRAFRRHCAETA